MKKFIFLASWRCEKIEKRLAKLEADGFRLTRLGRFFGQFEECTPKNVRYVVDFVDVDKAKHRRADDFAVSSELTESCGATPVECSFQSKLQPYRITDTSPDASYVIESVLPIRDKRVFKYLRTNLFLYLFCVLCSAYFLFSELSADTLNVMLCAIWGCLLAIFASGLIFTAVGFASVLLKKRKNQNE